MDEICAAVPTSSDEQHPSTHSNVSEGLTKKGTPWSVDEHYAFLQGLEKLGRGNWRGISRFFVPTRTPTQVASHAQKHFLRVGGNTKRRSRFAAIEEEVYGPPGKAPTLAAGSSVRQSTSQVGAPRPVAALPPRAPQPTQPQRPSPASNVPRSYPAVPSAIKPQPSVPPKPGAQHPEMCPGLPAAALSGHPMAMWGHPGSLPPHCMYMPAGVGGPHQGEHPATAWMSPHSFMWGAMPQMMHTMAMGQPVPPGVTMGQPVAAANSTSSCGHSQAHNGGCTGTQTTRGPVSVGPSEDVAAGMATTSAGAANSIVAAGYPTGAFFSMPAFMHSHMHPMMQFAMQQAGASLAGSIPDHHTSTAPAAAKPANSGGSSPATSSSTQPSHTLVVAAQQLSADGNQREQGPAALPAKDAQPPSKRTGGVEQQPEAADVDDQEDDMVSAADVLLAVAKQAAAECLSGAWPFRPAATAVMWKPGTCTPPEVSSLLAQLQRPEEQEQQQQAGSDDEQQHSGTASRQGGVLRTLGVQPSRPSAFKPLMPAVISV